MFTKTLITVRDLLAPPGEKLSLEVEVERRWLPFLDPPLRGAEVEVEGLGTRTTDAEGRAFFPLGSLGPGTHRYRVRSGGEALVKVIPPDAPVFVCDIDNTISRSSAFSPLVLPNASIRPVEGSREALAKIAQSMTILYLTARDHIFAAKTRDWLRQKDFPEGPLYFRRARYLSVPAGKHKSVVLSKLRERFTRIAWGAGDTRADAAAYAENGITPLILRRGTLPAPAVCVRTWREILERVLPTP